MSEWAGLGVAVGGCLFLMVTSGRVVNGVLRGIAKEDVEGKLEKRVRDTGVVVGKCEDMSSNSLYFLAGTMVNVTYSLLVALVLKGILASF